MECFFKNNSLKNNSKIANIKNKRKKNNTNNKKQTRINIPNYTEQKKAYKQKTRHL